MTQKIVRLGNDPWSIDLMNFIKSCPHFLTAQQWQDNINLPLESTFYYKWLIETLEANGNVWNGILKNNDDVIKRCKQYRDMYLVTPKWQETYEITQQVVNESHHYYGYRPVKIQRNGTIDIWDGMHRLSLLASRNLPIEVTICERLPGWNVLYKEIEDLYPNRMLYQPIPHPDFSDWNVSIDRNKELVLQDFIKQNSINSVLDLGTCHGFTLYELKNVIKHGIGVEDNPIRFKIADLLLSKIGFECYNKNAIDHIETSKHVDCILCFAMLHHVSRLYPIEVFDRFLRTIAQKTTFLIYTLPRPNEDQFTWIYESKRHCIDEYILQLTGFKIRETVLTNSRDIKILEKRL